MWLHHLHAPQPQLGDGNLQACTQPETFEQLVKALEAAFSTGKKAAA